MCVREVPSPTCFNTFAVAGAELDSVRWRRRMRRLVNVLLVNAPPVNAIHRLLQETG